MLERKFFKDVGFKYAKNDVSILSQMLSVTKEDALLSDEQLITLANATLTYTRAIRGKTTAPLTQFNTVLQPEHFRVIDDCAIYKYVNDATLALLVGGSFQFGSAPYYRTAEDEKIKDEMEGFANLVIETTNRHIVTSLFSGFNFHIFCGTKDIGHRELMEKRFGRNLIRIKSIRAFAEISSSLLGAADYYFGTVVYSDLKLFKIKETVDIANANPDLSDEMFNCFYYNSFLPSLFVKPTAFGDELELRLTFKMAADCEAYKRVFSSELRQLVEVVT